ncbi:lengsin [Mixophyes fleayi]|uniref:lengsin n=1 Tax=Mixophyes fleayi TaxID=3061075 RepID=UPI003F4E2FEA
MDNEINTAEDQGNTENDEVDGSVISRLRRKRGVKVTGKYIPPLQWEKIHASHSVSSLRNSYLENIYDDMGKNFQASSMSTKLLLKDERQGTAQTDHGGGDTSKTEQTKQRKEPVVPLQVSSTKDAEDVPQEKIKFKQASTKNNYEKSNEDLLSLGSAIPKETLEELKTILKESPLIHREEKWNPKTNTSITQIQLPKCAENISGNPGLTFETFHPHLEKENQKPMPTITPETKQSHMITIEQTLPGPIERAEQPIQPVQQFDGTQILIPHKLSFVSGTKVDPPSTEFNDHLHTQRLTRKAAQWNPPIRSSTNTNILWQSWISWHLQVYTCQQTQADYGYQSLLGPVVPYSIQAKDVYPSASGIQNSLHLISCVEHIKQQIAREDIRFVRFEAADLHGVSRSKIIPARFFQEKAVNGIYMPRSYLELTLNSKDNGVDRTNPSHFNSDIILKPDLKTFQVLPWTEKTARVICDSFTFLGDPLLTSPRYLAKRLLSQLQESGFLLHATFTYDFFIFGVPEMINTKTISLPAATLLTDHDQLFMQELFDGMYYIGGNIESFSSSSGPGQMEISFQPEYGLTAADNAFTFKTAIKEVAKKHNYMASFHTDMGFYNSGLLSHSLWDVNGINNLFYSGSHVHELTDIGKNWLSGLLLHSAAISCLVAPGASCRKHLSKDIKDSKDSICATWGFNNNSCTYNLKSHGCNGIYIANKLCSATANPYLVLAATIAAGLDGIRNGLDFFDGSNSSTDLLELKESSVPLKLEDALSALEEDKCFRASLGEPFIQYFVAMKQCEIETEEVDPARDTFLDYFI